MIDNSVDTARFKCLERCCIYGFSGIGAEVVEIPEGQDQVNIFYAQINTTGSKSLLSAL